MPTTRFLQPRFLGAIIGIGLLGWAGSLPAQPLLCDGSNGYVAAPGGLRTFLWTPGMLASAKRDVAADPAALSRLTVQANAALTHEPYSVTDKTKLPASGDKHDYQSIGPYWWPTPGKRGGIPYERRDGKINPERDGPEFDLRRLQNFSDDVTLLSLAYYHSGDQLYTDHAAKLLRTWFIDPATRMNPNLTHAQAIPGRYIGRPYGIIDASRLIPVVESIGLLGPSGALGEEDQAALENWFGEFVGWMATSPNGRLERATKNNHGIYFDMLISQFALFARLDPVAEAVTGMFGEARIEPQFAADGTLPEELTRTRSWHYTLWTLHAAERVAQLGQCAGQDVASYRNAVGAGLGTALDKAAAVVDPAEDWPYKDIAFGDPGKMQSEDMLAVETFRAAAWYRGDPSYEAAAKRYADNAAASNIRYYLGSYPADPEAK